MSELITYKVHKKVTIITLNSPENFNALDVEGYLLLNELVQKAGEEPNTIATLIQSTGKFFSAGADVKKGALAHPDVNPGTDEEVYFQYKRHFLGQFLSRNISITETFYGHPKVLVVALNGPVIGLSAALVALADFVYGLDTAYFLTPFANLGLVAEGAASFSLLQRLGWSKANEALLASKPISAKDLAVSGFLNKLFSSKDFKSTEEFNDRVLKIIEDMFDDLVPDSIFDIKKLMRLSVNGHLAEASHQEAIGGVEKFSRGIPQDRFLAIATKSMKHKL
jgi:Delta3-Delta2-enoyl-CoA isomerase